MCDKLIYTFLLVSFMYPHPKFICLFIFFLVLGDEEFEEGFFYFLQAI